MLSCDQGKKQLFECCLISEIKFYLYLLGGGGGGGGGCGAGWFGPGCLVSGSVHGERGGSRPEGWVGGRAGEKNSGYNGGPPPGAVGGFGGGEGGAEDGGASGGGVGYSGGGSGVFSFQAGGVGVRFVVA